MHYWQRYLCFTMTCVTPYLCLDTFLLLIFPNITLLSTVYSTVAQYTMVIVNHGVWVNTTVPMDMVLSWVRCVKKNPRCDPCYTLSETGIHPYWRSEIDKAICWLFYGFDYRPSTGGWTWFYPGRGRPGTFEGGNFDPLQQNTYIRRNSMTTFGKSL